MSLSPEMQARYEANRLQMFKVTQNFHRYFWASLILGAIVFSTAFFAGALSTMDDSQQGAEKFYFAMSAGVFQILLGLANIILGALTAMKKRIPSFILIGLNLIGLIAIALNLNGTFAAANLLFLVAGLGLNIWVQLLFNADDLLREEPGYPLFSETASQPAKYEAPLHVLAAKRSGEMEALPVSQPEPAPAVQLAKQEASPFASVPEVILPPPVNLSKVTESSLGITDMPGNTGHAAAPAAPAMPRPEAVQLESLTNTMQGDVSALPQVSADAMLADMTALPSHVNVHGDASQLPSADEVRARLAAMKQAREEHAE